MTSRRSFFKTASVGGAALALTSRQAKGASEPVHTPTPGCEYLYDPDTKNDVQRSDAGPIVVVPRTFFWREENQAGFTWKDPGEASPDKGTYYLVGGFFSNEMRSPLGVILIALPWFDAQAEQISLERSPLGRGGMDFPQGLFPDKHHAERLVERRVYSHTTGRVDMSWLNEDRWAALKATPARIWSRA